MTRETALELIRRRDQTRTLAAAGRLTSVDLEASYELERRADKETEKEARRG